MIDNANLEQLIYATVLKNYESEVESHASSPDDKFYSWTKYMNWIEKKTGAIKWFSATMTLMNVFFFLLLERETEKCRTDVIKLEKKPTKPRKPKLILWINKQIVLFDFITVLRTND